MEKLFRTVHYRQRAFENDLSEKNSSKSRSFLVLQRTSSTRSARKICSIIEFLLSSNQE